MEKFYSKIVKKTRSDFNLIYWRFGCILNQLSKNNTVSQE